MRIAKKAPRSRARGRSPAEPRKPRYRTVEVTAAYHEAEEGGYWVETLDADGVFTEGDTIEEARSMLLDAVKLMLETAPHQFGKRLRPTPPGALVEKHFALIPA